MLFMNANHVQITTATGLTHYGNQVPKLCILGFNFIWETNVAPKTGCIDSWIWMSIKKEN